ncbi:MAG: ABC transporter ATP-binding protein [Candidatus Aquicultorales bacterium]
MADILEAKSLTKRYGNLTAVDSIDFTVESQEIFGFLGPNGAGKTTTLEMLEGLRQPDGGEVFVKELPVWPNTDGIKNLIGVQLQASSFYEELTVKETLILFASLYNRRLSAERIDELLDIVGLREKQNSYTRALSGGQKQRLAITAALVNDPEVVFLDEPTTGLDPQARRRIWEAIKNLRSDSRTIVLTTHYMEEAEVLCDRVAIIDQGKIIAIDTPENLIAGLGTQAKISFTGGEGIDERLPSLTGVGSVKGLSEEGTRVLLSNDPAGTITDLFDCAKSAGTHIEDLHISSATLEDVFLSMTGKELRD